MALATSRGVVALAATVSIAALAGSGISSPIKAAPPTTTSATEGATTGNDPYLQPAGNGGYDVKTYALKLAYGGKYRNIRAARVRIRAKSTQPLTRFSLDAKRGLRIDRVTVNGKLAEFHKTRNKLIISGFAKLRSGATFRTDVFYHGRPRTVRDTSGRGRYGWLRTPGGIVTYNEPVGASSWVPSNDVFYDKATWRMDIRVPKGLLAVSTGRLVKKTETRRRTRTIWVMRTPIQPYAQALAIDRFRYKARQIAGVRGFVAVAKGANVSVNTMLRRTRHAVRWLTRRLGRYPYKDTGAIVVSGGDSAMETAGRPTYSADPFYTSQETVVHEQAHQWFGNLITTTHAKGMWLHEGFATYLENVESAQRRRRSLDDVVHGQYVVDGWGDRDHGQFQKVPLADPSPRFLLNTTVYFRGQAAVHALRHELGNQVFWRTLRQITRIPHGQTTSTADFTKRLQQLTGKDLAPWADTWLHSRGYQRLPKNPSHRQVIREIGRPILDAAADWYWLRRGPVTSALRSAITSYSPMNQVIITRTRKSRSGKKRVVFVDFSTKASPLYPRAYASCLVFNPRSYATSLGADGPVRFSSNFRPDTFTTQPCPTG